MQLSDQQLLEVIARAPLVSMDLVLRNSEDRLLMGRRINEPAKGKWFVPGGRIFKDETLDTAFERICLAEIGQRHSRNEARFVGAFTHKYDTNFLLADGITTHYIVLAYELHLTEHLEMRQSAQHSEFRWFTPKDTDPDIHQNAKEYFSHPSRIDDAQYGVLNARRDSFNNLLWQTPVLSLTAQAFLFATILSSDVTIGARRLAAALAFITALASVQLLFKHRFMESLHATILAEHERVLGRYEANQVFSPATWLTKIKSHVVWAVLLLLFAVAAGFAFICPAAFSAK